MRHEDRRRVIEDTAEPDGLWTRLRDLEDHARGYCVSPKLSGVLDPLRKQAANEDASEGGVLAIANQSCIVQSLLVQECHHLCRKHHGQDPSEMCVGSIL